MKISKLAIAQAIEYCIERPNLPGVKSEDIIRSSPRFFNEGKSISHNKKRSMKLKDELKRDPSEDEGEEQTSNDQVATDGNIG